MNGLKSLQLLGLVVCVLVSSCYTFKGISIDYTKVKTFSIADFPNNASNVVPTLSQDFREALRLKIITESRLGSSSANGDVMFTGNIVGYDIAPVAPQPGETVLSNRLTIRINVKFVNQTDPEQDWETTFSWFADYDSSVNLAAIQDQLIQTILTQMVEDIFNKAFTNW